jgi:uncharacterized delta-60 repeat protein
MTRFLSKWNRRILSKNSDRNGSGQQQASRRPARRRSELWLELLEERTLLNAAGVLDPAFGQAGVVATGLVGPGLGEGVKVLVSGDQAYEVGSLDNAAVAIVRLNLADGSIDQSYGQGGESIERIGAAYDAALQADGKLLVSGRGGVARLNTDGSPDLSFNQTGIVSYISNGTLSLGSLFNSTLQIAPQGDKIIVCSGGGNGITVARLNSDGSLDPWFGNNGMNSTDRNISPRAMAVDGSDGSIVVVGAASSLYAPGHSAATTRFTAAGALDGSFAGTGTRFEVSGTGASLTAYAVAIQPDHKILMGGLVNSLGASGPMLVRYNTDGTVDNTFNPPSVQSGSFGDGILDLAVQGDGEIVAAERSSVLRYNADGSVNTAFQSNLISELAEAVTATSTGAVLATGYTQSTITGFRAFLTKIAPDGGADTGFGASGSEIVDFVSPRPAIGRGVAVDASGRVLEIGEVDMAGQADVLVTRVSPDGVRDAGFGTAGEVVVQGLGAGQSVAVQPDGKIVIGTDAGIARLHDDGSLDTSFNGSGLVDVGAAFTAPLGLYGRSIQEVGMALQGNEIVVAGTYDFGLTRSFAARFNSDGSLDTTFGTAGVTSLYPSGTSNSSYMHGFALDSDGSLVITETYYENSGFSPTMAVARLTPSGQLDTGFNSTGWLFTSFSPGAFNTPSAITIQADHKIVIGGYWNGASSGTGLIRVNADGSRDGALGSNGLIDTSYQEPLAVAIDADGKIVTALVTAGSGTLWRYNADGSADTSFGRNAGYLALQGLATGHALAFTGGGEILVGGVTSSNGGVSQFDLERYSGDHLFPPTAADDSASITRESPVTIGVLANDGDFQGYSLSIQSMTSPGHGTAVINANNTITYTPDTNFIGQDSFQYTAGGAGGTATATVTITVNAATKTRHWTGGGSDNLWSDAANWDRLPLPGDELAFYTISPDATVNDFPPGTTFGAIFVPPTMTISGPAQADQGTAFDLTLGPVSDGNPGHGGERFIVHWGDGTSDAYNDKSDFLSLWTQQGQLGNPAGLFDTGLSSTSWTAEHTYNSAGSHAVSVDISEASVFLDSTFNNGAGASNSSAGIGLAVDPASGRIVRLEYEYSDNSYWLDAYNPDGSPDTTFANGAGRELWPAAFIQTYSVAYGLAPFGLAIDSSGRILVGTDNFAVARFNTDGSLDATFGNNGIAFDLSLAQQFGLAYHGSISLDAQGRILEKSFNAQGNALTGHIVRFAANGTLDSTFGSGSGGTTFAFSVPAGNEILWAANDPTTGDLLVGAQSTWPQMALFRFLPDGTLDTTFGNGTGSVNIDTDPANANGFQPTSLAVDPSGRMILSGLRNEANWPYTWEEIIRLNPDGSLDNTFGNDGVFAAPGNISYMALDGRGRIIFDSSYGQDLGMRRLVVVDHPDGPFLNVASTTVTVDDAAPSDSIGTQTGLTSTQGYFGNLGDYAFAPQATDSMGRTLVPSQVGNDATIHVLRYNPDGSSDTSFGTDGTASNSASTFLYGYDFYGFDPGSPAVAIDSQGRILVTASAGTDYGEYSILARFLPDGTPDPTFGDLAAPPTTAGAGTAITLSGPFSDPGGSDDAPYSYAWSVTTNNGDVLPGSSGTLSDYSQSVPAFTFTTAAGRSYAITLTVSDKYGAVGTSSTTLTVAAPMPSIFVGEQPIATLSGLSDIYGVAVDADGNRYVAESGPSDVAVFAHGTTPTRYLTGVNNPTYLAFDHLGNLFVAGSFTSELWKFAPGSTTPTAYLTGTTSPQLLAVDANNNLFVANADANTVTEYAPDSTAPTATLTGLSGPGFLKFDDAGDLFVTCFNDNTVHEFAPDGTPMATFTGLNGPSGLAIDANENLFVGNFYGGTVSKFAPGATTPTATLTGVGSPSDLGFDAAGNLIVLDRYGTTASVFAPGTTTPTARLTGLNDALRMAFDAQGSLYVTNYGNSTVSKFVLLPPSNARAGSPITRSGGFTYPDGVPGAPFGYTWTVSAGNGDVVPGASGQVTDPNDHSVPDFTFTPARGGTYTVTLAVADRFGITGFQSTMIAVVALPTVAVSLPNNGVVGQVMTFNLTASDPTPADQSGTFRYDIAWGDNDDTFDQTVYGPAEMTVTHSYAEAGMYHPVVQATDQDGLTSPLGAAAHSFLVIDVNTADVQYVMSRPLPIDPTTGNPTLTLQGDSQAQADAVAALFQPPDTSGFTPLQPPAGATTPIDIVVTLDSAVQFNEASLVIPAGIRLQINGGTWIGGSPALTFSSGDLTITGATFVNATNAPTILVTGGHLTLRNDVIQESTAYNQAAIQVIGGTVDLGTDANPGDNTLNVNGPGAFVHNATSNPVAAVGDMFTVDGSALAPASLSGTAFIDFNVDGQIDFGEQGIGGVLVTLTGTDDLGNAVNLNQTTNSSGAYVFLNLRPGTYALTESQPAGYPEGAVCPVGTASGTAALDHFFAIALGSGTDGLNYNFSEQPPTSGGVQKGQAAGIGFWNNKNGQALIKALNGGAIATQLANWLATSFPHMFGVYAGSNNLTGKTNADVAALFQKDFLLQGVKLDAQVLATALSVYVTNATLDSTWAATKYGFKVGGTGLGTDTVSVGSSGDAFGVANYSVMSIMDLLLATDSKAVNGVLFGSNTTKRKEANDIFSAINQDGGI